MRHYELISLMPDAGDVHSDVEVVDKIASWVTELGAKLVGVEKLFLPDHLYVAHRGRREDYELIVLRFYPLSSFVPDVHFDDNEAALTILARWVLKIPNTRNERLRLIEIVAGGEGYTPDRYEDLYKALKHPAMMRLLRTPP